MGGFESQPGRGGDVTDDLIWYLLSLRASAKYSIPVLSWSYFTLLCPVDWTVVLLAVWLWLKVFTTFEYNSREITVGESAVLRWSWPRLPSAYSGIKWRLSHKSIESIEWLVGWWENVKTQIVIPVSDNWRSYRTDWDTVSYWGTLTCSISRADTEHRTERDVSLTETESHTAAERWGSDWRYPPWFVWLQCQPAWPSLVTSAPLQRANPAPPSPNPSPQELWLSTVTQILSLINISLFIVTM